jgi:hypothetical protein
MKLWGRGDEDAQVDHSCQILEQIASGVLKLSSVGILESKAYRRPLKEVGGAPLLTPCNEAEMIDRRGLEVVSERVRYGSRLHHAAFIMVMHLPCLEGLFWMPCRVASCCSSSKAERQLPSLTRQSAVKPVRTENLVALAAKAIAMSLRRSCQRLTFCGRADH